MNNFAVDEEQAVFNKCTGEIKDNWWGTVSLDFF